MNNVIYNGINNVHIVDKIIKFNNNIYNNKFYLVNNKYLILLEELKEV